MQKCYLCHSFIERDAIQFPFACDFEMNKISLTLYLPIWLASVILIPFLEKKTENHSYS